MTGNDEKSHLGSTTIHHDDILNDLQHNLDHGEISEVVVQSEGEDRLTHFVWLLVRLTIPLFLPLYH